MDSEYDIIIGGGGPAGLMAAKTIVNSHPNLSVLLVEKSTCYTESIKCGEGVWKKPFEKLIAPDPKWIRLEISKASFISPDNTQIVFSDSNKVLGYILNRPLMQDTILSDLSQSIDVVRGISVRTVIKNGDYSTVIFSDGMKASSKIFIDATGPSSHLGESFGIPHVNTDLEPALYAIIKGVSFPTDRIFLQMSSEYAPGGYVWIFPVDETTANVGIVFGKGYHKEKNIRETLNLYIEKFIAGGIIESWHGGAIPSFAENKRMAASGFIQCGDAGSLVNPITRSGISESMYSGKIAAESAISMLLEPKKSGKTAKQFEKKLYADYCKKMEKVAKVKKNLYRISDDEFNAAAHKLSSVPEEKITMLKILKTTITKSPRLLLAMRHLL